MKDTKYGRCHSTPKLQLVDKPHSEKPTPSPKVALTPKDDRESITDAWLAGRSMGSLFYSNRSFGFGLLDIENIARETLKQRLGIHERNRRIAEFIGRAA